MLWIRKASTHFNSSLPNLYLMRTIRFDFISDRGKVPARAIVSAVGQYSRISATSFTAAIRAGSRTLQPSCISMPSKTRAGVRSVADVSATRPACAPSVHGDAIARPPRGADGRLGSRARALWHACSGRHATLCGMTPLEKELETVMMDLYQKWKEISYRATYFKRMLTTGDPIHKGP